MSFLLDFFAVELASYAIMHNHLHTVLRSRPDLVEQLSDYEVAERWVCIFSSNMDFPNKQDHAKINLIASSPEYIHKIRERLSSLSWFHRCLNEYVARRANFEDSCTGRFWEGRFKCQKLEGANSVIAASVYVDLNPIRAGMAKDPASSDYTSIQDRIAACREDCSPVLFSQPKLLPISELSDGILNEYEYIELVDQAGRAVVDGKHRISEKVSCVLDRIKIKTEHIRTVALKLGSSFGYFIGPKINMQTFAQRNGLSRILGVKVAEAIFS
jgi:REP element-mobilizing transposase RayT